MLRPPRLVVAALAFLAGASTCLLSAGPAAAVQTDTWGMSGATMSGDYQAELVHPADGSPVKALVLVWNRTAAPLTVHLSVLSVAPQNGTFAYSPGTRGLATHVTLPVGQVTLPAKQEARVTVVINEPAGSTAKQYAAISGEAEPVHKGVLSVQERLAVIIEATPHAGPTGTGVPGGAIPAVPAKNGGPHKASLSGPVLFFGSIGAAFLFIILVLLDRERRRKDEDLVAEAAAKLTIDAAYLRSLPPPKADHILVK